MVKTVKYRLIEDHDRWSKDGQRKTTNEQKTAKYDERRQKTVNSCNFWPPDISFSAEVYILVD